MPKFILKNAYLKIGSTEVSNLIENIELVVGVDQHEASILGTGTRLFRGGLKNWSASINFRQDFAALDSLLWPLVGERFAIEIRPDAGPLALDNPTFQGTGFLKSYGIFGNSIGQTANAPVQILAGGSLSRIAPFLPSADSSLRAWYDAGDPDTVTLNESNELMNLDDKSGNNLHLESDGTFSGSPWGETLDGKNVVDFSNDGALFSIDSVDIHPPGEARIIACLWYADGSGGSFNILGSGSYLELISPDHWFIHPAPNNSFPFDFDTDGKVYITVSIITPSLSVTRRIDGLEVDVRPVQPRPGTFSWINDDSSRTWAMAEFIISADTSVSTAEKFEGYLAHRWGSSDILDPSHPYKTDPPTV